MLQSLQVNQQIHSHNTPLANPSTALADAIAATKQATEKKTDGLHRDVGTERSTCQSALTSYFCSVAALKSIVDKLVFALTGRSSTSLIFN